MQKMNIEVIDVDILVIGGGASGLMSTISATLASNSDLKILCVSKSHPLRSGTVMAQGGIAAPLGNAQEDKIEWHMYDTVQSGCGLADEDAVETLCRNASAAVLELENMGVLFSRDKNGNIAQRKFGGMTYEFGKGLISRTCYAGDRTGHSILYALYSSCLRLGVQFLSEFLVTSLIKNAADGFSGAIGLNLKTGQITKIHSTATILASGGYGRIFENSTTSTACTGDGTMLALQSGLPIKDVEFVQFHPTGIADSFRLISEAVRGHGGYLTNIKGERFMEKYHKLGDLSPRDVLSRAMMTEVELNQGCGDRGDYFMLNGQVIDKKIWESELSSVRENAYIFANVDATRDPIPVLPVAHYCMGGISTDINCTVLNGNGDSASGLFACGEVACVSVHGANRLGSNSLLETVVFGRIAGLTAVEFCDKFKKNIYSVKCIDTDHSAEQIKKIVRCTGTTPVLQIMREVQSTVQKFCGVIKTTNGLEEAKRIILGLIDLFNEDVAIVDRSFVWNRELMDFLVTKNLLTHALVMIEASLSRKESRGAHFIKNFPNTDLEPKHSICTIDDKMHVKVDFSAVRKIN